MIYASSSSTNYKSILQHIFNATNFTIFTTLFLGMIVQQIEWDSFTIHFTHLITTLFNNLFITLHPSFSSSIQFMNNTFTTISSQLMKQFMEQYFHNNFITKLSSQLMNNTFTTISSQQFHHNLWNNLWTILSQLMNHTSTHFHNLIARFISTNS